MSPKKPSKWSLEQLLNSPKFASNLFVILTMAGLILLALTQINHRTNQGPITSHFSNLEVLASAGGIAQFQQDKMEFKKEVQELLKNPRNQEEEALAYGFALYLFPELLPDSNFEKETALTFWAPLEQEIEKKPKTPEARMLFEELRTNIWKYENPKFTSAGLSLPAEKTLKIYYELSSP